MAAQPQQQYLTPEEYLDLDRASPIRNEYYYGRMFPAGAYDMAGGSYFHSVIIPSVAAGLINALEQRRCTVSTSEIRVRASGNMYAYPDVAVVCGAPRFSDDRPPTLLNPLLVVEVLSTSTEKYDRGAKFAEYRKLESLQEYALVSQVEPRVEVLRLQPSGQWLMSEFSGADASCHFTSIECSVALAAIYARVTFDE